MARKKFQESDEETTTTEQSDDSDDGDGLPEAISSQGSASFELNHWKSTIPKPCHSTWKPIGPTT